MTSITDLDAVSLSAAIRQRQLSCREVMQAYLARIERVNPQYNALVSVQDPSALLAQADERDAQLARGQWLGFLHGIPQAVKDLAPVKSMRFTRGSPIFAEQVATVDALFVQRMKAAGAIVIAKTNTPEFGLGSQTYNPVFGVTRNAWNPAWCAGGSSGGAAVALAQRLLPAADGSDMGGSLRNPAAFNNVYGFRPSQGRVPKLPDTESFLQQLGIEGPMGRTVADVAQLLAIMAGAHREAPLSLADDPGIFAQPLGFELKGRRIGWLGDLGGYLPMEEGVLALCRTGARVFSQLGAFVDEARLGFDPARLWQCWLTLRSCLVSGALMELYEHPEHRDRLKPEARWEIEQGLGTSSLQVYRASCVRTQWYQQVVRLFERYDFLLQPSAQVFAFDAQVHWPDQIAGRTMDTYHRWMEVVVPWTLAGCPVLNIPVGFDERGRPMGMQLIGPPRADLAVLAAGHVYDQATDWARRQPPETH
jgi:amidase